jgi:hypothetical protein
MNQESFQGHATDSEWVEYFGPGVRPTILILVTTFFSLVLPISVFGQAPRDTTMAVAVHEAATDSSKPIPLPVIEVSADRVRQVGDNLPTPMSTRELYSDDAYKSLTHDVRLSAPAPFSATLNLHGLPVDQGARPYLWDHKIIGRTTLLFGGYSIVNPDLMDVELHPVLISHKFRETNGAVEFFPKHRSDRPVEFVASTDGIERRGTLSLASGSDSSRKRADLVTSIRQNQVIGLLTAIKGLEVIPESMDNQTFAKLQFGAHTLQGFCRFGREKGDWHDPADARKSFVQENSFQQLAFVQYDLRLPRGLRLGLGTSWEKNDIDSHREFDQFKETIQAHSEIFNPRMTVSTDSHRYTFFLGNTYAKSDRRGSNNYSSADGGVEGKFLFGRFTVEPSASVQQLRDQYSFLHGITVSVYPKRTAIIFGYGTYADYFVYDNGMFGSVFDAGGAQRPQRSNHYAVTVESRPEHQPLFDILRVSAVRKDLNIDFRGRRSDVQVLSGDITLAKAGKLNYEAAYSFNQDEQDGGLLVGSVDQIFRLGIGYRLTSNLSFSLEANHRGGLVAENDNSLDPRKGERYRLNPATYVNLAVTERRHVLGQPMDITLTLFNIGALIGNRAEIARFEGNTYTTPFWGNLRIRYGLR